MQPRYGEDMEGAAAFELFQLFFGKTLVAADQQGLIHPGQLWPQMPLQKAGSFLAKLFRRKAQALTELGLGFVQDDEAIC